MNLSYESRVGIFVTVTLVILIIGYNYLRGKDLFKSVDTYYAIYDNIDGLEKSNPVLFKGYQIGKITDIELRTWGQKQIVVEFTVKDKFPIPVGSKARIINSDLLGSKALELVVSDAKIYHKKFDTLKSEVALSISATIDNYISPITNKANTIMGKFEEYLNEGGKEELQMVISSLGQTAKNLEAITSTMKNLKVIENLSQTVNHLNAVAANLEQNNEKINNILSNLESVSDSLKVAQLAQTLEESRLAIEEIKTISQKINESQGSLGLMVNDSTLYNNMNTSLEYLNKLIKDLNENPKKYVHFSVFGRSVEKEKK